MIESSHKQENWFTMGVISKSITGLGFIVKDLIVRWNERQCVINGPDEGRTEYIYNAIRFDIELPLEVQPGVESVEYYLEQAKSSILTMAQALASQEDGFYDPN